MIDFDCCWPTEQAPTLTFNVLKKEAAVPAEITIWSKTFFKNFLLFDWSLVLKTSLSFYFVNFYDWFRLLLAYWTGPYPWFQRFEKRSSRSSRKNDLVDDLFSRILDPRTHLSLKFIIDLCCGSFIFAWLSSPITCPPFPPSGSQLEGIWTPKESTEEWKGSR